MQDELFKTFDASGNSTGLVPRSRVHRDGLWHCAANVFLFRSDGHLVIQRRQWNKDVCPGVWDLSVAEHLKPGETYEQAATRGLREELGVAQVGIERIGSVTRAKFDIAERGVKDHELQQSFRGVFDGVLRPNSDEVCEIGTLDVAELSVAFAERPNDFTPWFRSSAIRLGLCTATPLSGSPVLEPQVAAHAAEMFAVLSDPAIYEFEGSPPESQGWLERRFARLESRVSDDGEEEWLNWVVRLPGGVLAGYVQATIPRDGAADRWLYCSTWASV